MKSCRPNWKTLWLTIWTGAAAFIFLFKSDSAVHFQLTRTLNSPTLSHPFGFDAFGRDLVLLTLRSSLMSTAFSLGVVLLSLLSATVIAGALALCPQKLRAIPLRLLEGLLAFPSLIFALAWAAIRGPGWTTLLIALFMGVLPGFARLLYLRAQELLTQEYIEAAVGLGATRRRIFSAYVAPELFRLSLVKFPGLFAQTLLAEATLSFLGIGAPIGQDTWGSLLAQGKDYLIEAPHLALATGIPLILTVLALQGISEHWELLANRRLS